MQQHIQKASCTTYTKIPAFYEASSLDQINMTEFWFKQDQKISCCQFFGHVHKIWLYSFGHVDSVM